DTVVLIFDQLIVDVGYIRYSPDAAATLFKQLHFVVARQWTIQILPPRVITAKEPRPFVYIHHIVPKRFHAVADTSFQRISNCKDRDNSKNTNGDAKQGKGSPQTVNP